MTDYRRLTEKNINDAEFCNECNYNDDFNGCEAGGCDKYFLYFNVYERLRKLEDMIENKELVNANDIKSENAALRERLSHSLELPCMAKLEIVDDNDKHIKYIYFIFYKENGKFSSIKYLNKGAAESELAKLKGEKK